MVKEHQSHCLNTAIMIWYTYDIKYERRIMKFIILLLLAQDPIYIPFDNTFDCHQQGKEVIESIASYQGPGVNQGWYTKKGALIFGFYCE